MIDSVASQANRQEAALVAAPNSGLIDFADVYIDLTETEAGLNRLSATEMPHRLSDAILRDSELEGDVLVVTRLDRLARSVADVVTIEKRLRDKGAALCVLDPAMDTSTPTGRLVFNVIASIA